MAIHCSKMGMQVLVVAIMVPVKVISRINRRKEKNLASQACLRPFLSSLPNQMLLMMDPILLIVH